MKDNQDLKNKKNMKITFLINSNDIGGAEYVSYQHVRMAVEMGYDVRVVSGETGFFYEKIKSVCRRVLVWPEMNYSVISEFQRRLFLKAIADSDVIFNCNWFAIHKHVKSIKRLCKFKYYSIIHSNIDWVLQNTIPYDGCIDKYYSINRTIVSAFVKKGISEKKFIVIPNCVDTAVIYKKGSLPGIREQFEIDDTDLVIGMTTRVAPDKNVLDAIGLIEAINAGGRSASLVVLGGAPDNAVCIKYEERLKQISNASKYASKIKFAGKLPTEEIYRMQTCFDVAINVSPSEGLPISLLEQMAAGIYCMYPGVGEIPEVLLGFGFVGTIKQRLTAQDIYKSPNYTDEELKQWTDHLLSLTRGRMDQTGYEASEYVRKYRSYEVWKNQFINFLNS